MTDSNSTATLTHSAIGVVKFSQEKAGLPDVRKIAEEWAKDSGFKQVIIRKVSKDDYGIQFIFITTDEAMDDKQFNKWFSRTYVDQHFHLVYALDISFGSTDSDSLFGSRIIKNEPLR